MPCRDVLSLEDSDDELYQHSDNQLPGQKLSSLDALICPQRLTPHGLDPTCPNLRFIGIQVGTASTPLNSAFSCVIYVYSFLEREKKKVKIFYMLFKLINIRNQRQFGKSVSWLEAHRGSAHLVKPNLAEVSFYL